MRRAAVHPVVLARLDRRRTRLRALARRRRLRARAAARRARGARGLPRPPRRRRTGARPRRAGTTARARGELAAERAHPLAARRGRCAWRRSWRTASASPSRPARWRRVAAELARGSDRAFWNEKSGLYADSPGGSRVQRARAVASRCWAEGSRPARRERVARSAAARRSGAIRPTVHTAHYLFEACAAARPSRQVVLDRLAFWVGAATPGPQDTPIESAEPTRSDCHAWGSHPLYHFFATAARHPARRPGVFAQVNSHPCSARSSTRRAASFIPREARSWSISSRRAAHSTAVSCCRPRSRARCA